MKCTAVTVAAWLWSAGLAWCSPASQQRQHALDPAPFPEQAARLLETIKMPAEQLAAVPLILQDLEDLLNTHWPGSRVEPFGSIVSGLALVGSDIDTYALLPDPTIKPHRSINFKAVHVLKQSLDYANITLKLLHITFQYAPMHTKIDLLFNNVEGGRNTEIIRYFLSSDKRVLDVALIVKYWWAKTQKLAESKIVPSYGMTCLVIFYLQQVGMLPPISILQKHAKPDMFYGWNLGFDEPPLKIRNNETLYQLLGGFFQFYDEFNYDKYIISPFMGHPVKRRLFKYPKSVPDEFEYYRRNVSDEEEPLDLKDEVIIQDVFLHNQNLAARLGARESSPFTTEFRRIALKYRQNNEKTFLDEILSVEIH